MMSASLEPIVTSGQGPYVTLLTVTLAGMGDMPRITTSRDVVRQFAARLNGLCDNDPKIPPEGEGRQGAVGKLFGVSQKGARKWLKAEGLPERHTLILMAVYFDVQVDWLETGREPRKTFNSLSPKHRRLIEAYDKAEPGPRQIVNLALCLSDM